jgi:hypothetical protein
LFLSSVDSNFAFVAWPNFLMNQIPRHSETKERKENSDSSICVGGDPKFTKGIIINENPFQVTTNLEIAFRRLRAKGYSRLWVDVVCINQDDKVERSRQLLLMGSIYRRAKEVAAWTGEENNHLNAAMDALDASGAPPVSIPSLSGTQIGSLVNFLERPYWKCVWIIQELALAKHTTIHCGGRQISWS